MCLILNIGSDCGSDCQLLDGVWLILNFAENEWSGVLDIEYWILDFWPSIALLRCGSRVSEGRRS